MAFATHRLAIMERYMLSRHAHLCVTGDHVVIMDITSGTYIGLSPQQACSLASWVQGWPCGDSSRQSPEAGPPPLINQLLGRGVLTAEPALGKSATPLRRRQSTMWLADTWLPKRPTIRAAHVWRFARAVIRAKWLLRWQSLERVIALTAERKRLACHAVGGREDILRLVAIFEKLRPWIYGRRETCMLHSLAVLGFLAHYGLFPDWVIGVRVEPFRAHSWLEYRDFVLTDTPESLDAYTPIIAI